MRSLAYPAENPNKLKNPNELMEYYSWMLSDESSSSDKTLIEFGDISELI